MLPQMLSLTLGVVGLDRIQAVDGFNQDGLALGRQRHGALHDLGQRTLQQPANDGGNREGQQRDQHHVAANQGNHGKNEQREGQVNQAGQRQ